MDTGGGLFGNAPPFLDEFVKDEGILGVDFLEEILDDFFLVGTAFAVDPLVAFLQFIPFVEEKGDVATVVDDQLRALAFGIDDGFPGAVPIFLEGLAFPGEDGDPGLRDGGGGVVLRRKNVAARPTHGRAESDESLDEDSRLNGHVERAGHADTGQRLLGRVLLAN